MERETPERHWKQKPWKNPGFPKYLVPDGWNLMETVAFDLPLEIHLSIHSFK
jgi:hypothetical protein